MREKNTQKKRTRRAGVCAFVLTAEMLAFVGGMYTVDAVTGRTLHGTAYRTSIDVTAVSPRLPARLRVVWELLTGDYAFFLSGLDNGR